MAEAEKHRLLPLAFAALKLAVDRARARVVAENHFATITDRFVLQKSFALWCRDALRRKAAKVALGTCLRRAEHRRFLHPALDALSRNASHGYDDEMHEIEGELAVARARARAGRKSKERAFRFWRFVVDGRRGEARVLKTFAVKRTRATLQHTISTLKIHARRKKRMRDAISTIFRAGRRKNEVQAGRAFATWARAVHAARAWEVWDSRNRHRSSKSVVMRRILSRMGRRLQRGALSIWRSKTVVSLQRREAREHRARRHAEDQLAKAKELSKAARRDLEKLHAQRVGAERAVAVLDEKLRRRTLQLRELREQVKGMVIGLQG